jgi:hypothetical protein
LARSGSGAGSYGAAKCRRATPTRRRSRGASLDIRASGPLPALARSAWPAAAAVLDVRGGIGGAPRDTAPTAWDHWRGRVRALFTGRPSVPPAGDAGRGGRRRGSGSFAHATQSLLSPSAGSRAADAATPSRRRTSSASVYGRTWTMSVEVDERGFAMLPPLSPQKSRGASVESPAASRLGEPRGSFSAPGPRTGRAQGRLPAAEALEVELEEDMQLALNPQYHVISTSCCERACSAAEAAGARAVVAPCTRSVLWRGVACCWLEESSQRRRSESSRHAAVEMAPTGNPLGTWQAADESIAELDDEGGAEADEGGAGGSGECDSDGDGAAGAVGASMGAIDGAADGGAAGARCMFECEWVYFGCPRGVRGAVASLLVLSMGATVYACAYAPWFTFNYGGAIGKDLAQRHNVAVYTKDRTIWPIGLEIASGNYIHDERTATPPDPDNPLAGKYAVDGHVDYAIYYTVFTWFALVAAAPMLFNLAVLMLWTAPQAWPGEYKLFLIHASQLLAAWNALDVAALACIVSVTEVGNVLHGTLYQLETSVEDLFQVACGGDAGQCLVITTDLRYGFWIAVAAIVRRAGRALRATVAENGSTFRERCCAQR